MSLPHERPLMLTVHSSSETDVRGVGFAQVCEKIHQNVQDFAQDPSKLPYQSHRLWWVESNVQIPEDRPLTGMADSIVRVERRLEHLMDSLGDVLGDKCPDTVSGPIMAAHDEVQSLLWFLKLSTVTFNVREVQYLDMRAASSSEYDRYKVECVKEMKENQ